MRRRWIMLLGVFVANLLILFVFGRFGAAMIYNSGPKLLANSVPYALWPEFDSISWWASIGIPALVVAGSQLAFVAPLCGQRPVISVDGKPLWFVVAAAAVVAGALTAGLLFAVLELLDLFATVLERIFSDEVHNALPPSVSGPLQLLWPWIFIAAGWLLWLPLLLTFARRRAESRWGRWVGLLLGGTVLETLIVVPIDLMVRRRTECYCAAGSYFALLISMWALLWLTGPGIVVALTSKRRRLWYETHCTRCGYEKGPSPGPRCPECGHAWIERR